MLEDQRNEVSWLKQIIWDKETDYTKLTWDLEDALNDKKKLLESDVNTWDIISSLESKIKKLEQALIEQKAHEYEAIWQ